MLEVAEVKNRIVTFFSYQEMACNFTFNLIVANAPVLQK